MMPDSRYAISNVEWPDFERTGPLDMALDNHPMPGVRFVPAVPATAYEELLEVAEDMARFIEWTENNRGYLAVRVMPNDIQDAGQKALANFRASSSTPTRTRNEK